MPETVIMTAEEVGINPGGRTNVQRIFRLSKSGRETVEKICRTVEEDRVSGAAILHSRSTAAVYTGGGYTGVI